MVTLQVQCLGRFALRGEGDWSPGPAFKRGREFLEYFTAYADRAVARATLVDILWPDVENDCAAHRLHIAVSGARNTLRGVLPAIDCIRSSGGGYEWHPSLDVRSDMKVFLDLAKQSTVEAMEAGIAMYRGDFLAGEEADWIWPLRIRCASAFATMLERLADAAANRKDHTAALDFSLRLIETDRAHEGATRQAMRSFAALGRRGAALGEYDELRKFLRRHLGVAPSQSTRELYDAIRSS